MKLALRGAVGVAALGLLVFLVSARALEAARFTPQAIIVFRIGLVAAVAALVALPARPPAAAEGPRRAGGDVSRGARADAPGVDHQRDRGRARQLHAAFAGAGSEAGRRSDPEGAGDRVRQARRAAAGETLRGDDRGGRRGGDRAVHVRSGVPAARRIRAVHVLAAMSKRPSRTGSRSSRATPRSPEAPTRSSRRSCRASTPPTPC